eukprot:scaffold32948_cov131-Isochrysis_galbana.AAC.4
MSDGDGVRGGSLVGRRGRGGPGPSGATRHDAASARGRGQPAPRNTRGAPPPSRHRVYPSPSTASFAATASGASINTAPPAPLHRPRK